MIPFLSLGYLGCAILVLILRADRLPEAFHLIFSSACSPVSAAEALQDIPSLKPSASGLPEEFFPMKQVLARHRSPMQRQIPLIPRRKACGAFLRCLPIRWLSAPYCFGNPDLWRSRPRFYRRRNDRCGFFCGFGTLGRKNGLFLADLFCRCRNHRLVVLWGTKPFLSCPSQKKRHLNLSAGFPALLPFGCSDQAGSGMGNCRYIKRSDGSA